MDLKRVLVVSGATATGKTKTSIEIAIQGDIEIVNFDSLVFYKELNIGTAKPTADEIQDITHHLVGTQSITNPMNAADFCKIAPKVINSIIEKGKTPLLVGGSGFYLKALLLGMYPTKTPSDEIINKSNSLYKAEGIQAFWKILEQVDKPSTEKLHINDHYRVRRAVEFYWTSGYPISEAPLRQNQETKFYKTQNWDPKHIYLNIPKEDHYEIMLQRTKNMIQAGLIDEVKNLVKQGHKDCKPLQSIGYKETIDYLDGKIESQDELIEKIFISTRRLAKAQRTWFQSVTKKEEFNPLDGLAPIIHYALKS